MVIPRKAVHQGRVYVVTEENTLAIRPVEILFDQGNLLVLSEPEQHVGIKEGEKIIISDVIPVMEGMPLKLIHANDYQQQLAHEALAGSGTSSYK